jgi:hypothetical protein
MRCVGHSQAEGRVLTITDLKAEFAKLGMLRGHPEDIRSRPNTSPSPSTIRALSNDGAALCPSRQRRLNSRDHDA